MGPHKELGTYQRSDYLCVACDALPMPNQLTISPVLAGTLQHGCVTSTGGAGM